MGRPVRVRLVAWPACGGQHFQRIGPGQGHKHRFEGVEAIGAALGDVEAEVELGVGEDEQESNEAESSKPEALRALAKVLLLLVASASRHSVFYARHGKRLLDVAAGPAAAAAHAAAAGGRGGAGGLQNRGRWLFRQARPGWHGQLFTLYKLQTMTERATPPASCCPTPQRLPRLGRWLRATSPRRAAPALERAARRPEPGGPAPAAARIPAAVLAGPGPPPRVRPGLTGWAQVNGRNAITWEEKFAFDVWYVDHRVAGASI